ncbi:MAG: copper oxidase [Cyanobacteria bacterium REEB67]|nr:copper oxidase [Cyanobacteria bacterium REEB67]
MLLKLSPAGSLSALISLSIATSPVLAAPQTTSKTISKRPPTKFISRPPVPVITPDLAKLPWKMENGVKVFHMSADICKREIMPASDMGPAKILSVWGFNGSAPGPTIEVNEGDHVRFIFKNNLPESTTIHWHGLEIPIEMDGMPFISQPMVKPGETFVYDFTLHQNGTFFYHSHGAMQEMMGMIGFFIIHPKVAHDPPVQKDFGLCLQEWAVLPNNSIPNSMSMEYNWLTINGRAAPATTPLIVKEGDRVRIRIINMGMDHHPIHIHGHQFVETGTEGGRAPKSTWRPENTVIVGVAQSRDIEFLAKYPGDWMLHCHLPHHMMNNMVSMVGPMAHPGMGMHTGSGMQEGMGMVRGGNATAEDLGPALGRGMGNTADREQMIANGPRGSEATGTPPTELKPGFPQDDMMMTPMDAAVAKPENNGLKAGWSGSLAGMMNLIRVLPADKYDKLLADIKAGRIESSQSAGMNMDHMNMPGMEGMPMNHSGTNSSSPKKGKPETKTGPTMEEQMKMDPNMKM